MSKNIYQPYTYHLRWSEQDLHYYGVRYAQGCHSGDLWESYFSSSKFVDEARIIYGEPDLIEIRKTFADANDAVSWEQRVLDGLHVCHNPQWLNRAQSGGRVLGPGPAHNHYGKPKPAAQRKKMSISRLRYFENIYINSRLFLVVECCCSDCCIDRPRSWPIDPIKPPLTEENKHMMQLIRTAN